MNALRRPEVRGQWGEMTLRRLAELAGMVEHCDFTEQLHRAADDGALRPDMIVNMPDGRDLVVDVKTPLDAYLGGRSHHRRGRGHAAPAPCTGRDRARPPAGVKTYWSQFEKSPDFVILFIPGDQFLARPSARSQRCSRMRSARTSSSPRRRASSRC